MKSIRYRLVFMYLTLVFIVMIISGTFIIIRTQSVETQKAEKELRQYAKYIYEQIVLTYNDPEDFQTAFSGLTAAGAAVQTLQGSILDTSGQTVASTLSSDKRDFPAIHNAVAASALSGTEKFDPNIKGADQTEWLAYAMPAMTDDTFAYAVYVQMNKEAMNLNLNQTKQTMVWAILLALILAVLLGLLFADTITAPIAVLTRKSHMLAKGNLEQQIPIRSNDEIGHLTRSFNHMARELRKTLSNMEKEKNKLEILVQNNTTEGVLLFDEMGFLIHANKVCAELLQMDEVYFSLLEFLSMTGITREDLRPGRVNELTLSRNEKYIGISFIPYRTAALDKESYDERLAYGQFDGVIVVMRDITKFQLLDNMRKDFVANVSHEIRTPLTTIKSYAETLLEGALSDHDTAIEFLTVIDSEADRMALLAQDLLELSRLDNKQFRFQFEMVNLYQLVQDAIRQNAVVAKQKNQTISIRPPTNQNMPIIADPGRINQVLNNILSNASKYSPENTKIIVSAQEDAEHYYVAIEDAGLGIPKDDLERVFERFYRVDKARSRAMGGTGLGLSISKDIMEGHSGTIIAQSEPGKGTTMTLVFPKEREVT